MGPKPTRFFNWSEPIMSKRLITPALVAVGLLFGIASNVQASEALAKSKNCMACHAVDKKMVGPSYKDVAAKYKGQDAVAKLTEKVRKGGAGSFGPIPMSPNGPDKINDADLKESIEFILKS